MQYRFLIYGLLASILLIVALAIWLGQRVRINQRQQNRSPWALFLPCLLGGLLTYVLLFQFQPRLLDTIDILSGNVLSLDNVSEETVRVEGRRLLDRQNVYVLPPGMEAPVKGKLYRMTFGKHSHLVYTLEDIAKANGDNTSRLTP